MNRYANQSRKDVRGFFKNKTTPTEPVITSNKGYNEGYVETRVTDSLTEDGVNDAIKKMESIENPDTIRVSEPVARGYALGYNDALEKAKKLVFDTYGLDPKSSLWKGIDND